MGRRKEPQTKEEIQTEIAHTQNEIRKLKNQEKLYANAYAKEERKLRTRRLCREAGVLEHFAPELKTMTEQEAAAFIRTAATSQEAQEFLRKRGTNHDETDTDSNSSEH
ncbi:MAG: DUF3847 domain-containing protein [Clostridiales bacterium]|nr:DUF3847 domain-containing protein [Clostridiales bacterium]MCD8368686.1 DUF3847 domain-containing protein [Clostridiales bacterium]